MYIKEPKLKRNLKKGEAKQSEIQNPPSGQQGQPMLTFLGRFLADRKPFPTLPHLHMQIIISTQKYDLDVTRAQLKHPCEEK